MISILVLSLNPEAKHPAGLTFKASQTAVEPSCLSNTTFNEPFQKKKEAEKSSVAWTY